MYYIFKAFLGTHSFQVHRSFIINPNCTENHNQQNEFLTMSNRQKANTSLMRKYTLKGLAG